MPLGCYAADKNGKFRETYPPDHVNCEAYLLAVNECNHRHCGDIKTFSDWLMGFVTAYNMQTPNTFDIVAKIDLKTALNWLASYCKKNRTKKYSKAVHSLMIELYPKRQKMRNYADKVKYEEAQVIEDIIEVDRQRSGQANE